MLSRRTKTLVAMAAALLLMAGTALAQSTAATLSGTVKDQSGATVPAKITLTNRATHASRVLLTNERGLFVAPDVEEGVYDVSVEKQGFRTLTSSGVTVNPQERLSLGELLLQVGTSTDSVTVAADAGRLQLRADSGERSADVTNTQLRDLALNGRNIHDLAKLIPGVASPAARMR